MPAVTLLTLWKISRRIAYDPANSGLQLEEMSRCPASSICSTGVGTPANRSPTGRGCASTRPRTGIAKNEIWALTRYDDVLAAEKDPATFSSYRAPRPHGDHLPMMISMDAPEHSRRRKLVSRGFTPRRVRDHEADDPPHLHRDHRPRRARRAVRLRLGHRRAAAAAAHRRHARLPARVLRRLAAVVRRPDPRHDRGPAAGGDGGRVATRCWRSASSSSVSSPTAGRSRRKTTS